MGFKRIITYTLESEPGTSLKASGWRVDSDNVGGKHWSVPSRPRVVCEETLFGEKRATYPIDVKKTRWIKELN
jgi:hypothetical protein